MYIDLINIGEIPIDDGNPYNHENPRIRVFAKVDLENRCVEFLGADWCKNMMRKGVGKSFRPPPDTTHVVSIRDSSSHKIHGPLQALKYKPPVSFSEIQRHNGIRQYIIDILS